MTVTDTVQYLTHETAKLLFVIGHYKLPQGGTCHHYATLTLWLLCWSTTISGIVEHNQPLTTAIAHYFARFLVTSLYVLYMKGGHSKTGKQDILYLTSPAFMCRRERLLGNVGKLTYNLNVMPCGANRRNKEATLSTSPAQPSTQPAGPATLSNKQARPALPQNWQPAGVIRVSAPLARLRAKNHLLQEDACDDSPLKDLDSFRYAVTDVAEIGKEGELTLYPPGARCNEMEPLLCFPMEKKNTSIRAPSAGSVGRDSWCCESGRRSPGTGYFPTPGSHLHPSHLVHLEGYSRTYL
ncbi:hypothetical protein E3U43_010219 [Larimichthys crocea]|uniref:Uncharacterized protein n=1 Tax=Larimichthys crocea TaxID=215358 RepID=A0ACD3REM0_LARCR|nr:hypothetical protein E3U43_010219 [Larimichthys crocea]